MAQKWTDEEVISRWSSLFPSDAKKYSHIPSKIPIWHERLTSISWFMRCINETIAKASNDEDNCTGRFWEGRFKSQALLDEGALLSAMAYVDLNPIRAGIAQTPEASEFTSIYERIKCISASKSNLNTHSKQPPKLLPFSNGLETGKSKINFELTDYLELVDYTGRVLREGKFGVIPEHLPPLLCRLNFDKSGWLSMIKNMHHQFYYAIGNEICLINFSHKRKRAIKGLSAAKKLYLA